MAKPSRNIYPDISGIRNLPIFLAGVGGSADQTKVTREKGLQWNQIIRCGEGSGTAYDVGVQTAEEGGFTSNASWM